MRKVLGMAVLLGLIAAIWVLFLLFFVFEH